MCLALPNSNGHREGGDRVDADGNPLLIGLILAEGVVFGSWKVRRCTRLTPICLWHQNVKDAAFCR